MALAFAGKSVAVPAISAIARKSFEYLEKYMKAEGMKLVQERLERTLPQVQVVFDAIDMERIRDQSEALDSWLWQLRDAVEEAEDVLDEVEYYKLEKKVKTRGNKVSSSLYKCKRMFIQQFNIMFEVGTLKRMVDAMKKLDEVAAAVEHFTQLVDRFDSSSLRHICHQEIGNPRETSSFLVDETLIGRDTERDQIVEWLIKQEIDDQDHDYVCNVLTLAIVGIGGMGKTTLAQAVYNDKRVQQCFDHVMWVCVSNDFDARTLTRKILQEITREGTDITSLNTLQDMLRGKLSSKKFLLVFDDVWNDDKRPDWEKLVAPLKFGQKGSKILLTTRMQSVVDIVERVLGGRTESLRLEGLQEKDLLALFSKHAFFGVNPDDYMNLQDIGKQIIKKLSGSPLAAKVMGGVLNNSMDSISWNRILQENISNLEHGNQGVMKVLRLSYHHLPPDLQACFRYCSIFQEDYLFRKDELVNLWMGSGLIQVSANQRPEDVGEYYLGILTRKSFFELRSNESWYLYDGGSNAGEFSYEHYVIHDLLHELARTVSKKECIRISSNDCDIIPGTVRHIAIDVINHSVITDLPLKKLRTLDISFDKTIEERYQWHVLKNVLNVATKLRALTLHRDSPLDIDSPVKLPNAFDNLMHLRYLSISKWWGKVQCPPSVCKLYHMQMIKGCSWESCRLSKLINLRHLDYSGTQIGPPPHIGQLTSLQELRVNLKYERLSELKELKDLRYLYIDGFQNNNVEEAKLAKLAEKENLISLSLSWKGSTRESGTGELFLDNLQPHMSLAKLSIERYGGSRSPCWMGNLAIRNLVYIKIWYCPKWQHLPPLGSLPSLKYLHLMGMHAVKRIDRSFYGCEEPFGYPSLKVLSIYDLPALEEWVEMEGGNLFPQLKTLSITKCGALRNVPVLPPTLAYLKIDGAGLTALPSADVFRSLTELRNLEIANCSELATLDGIEELISLTELLVVGCNKLDEHLRISSRQTCQASDHGQVAAVGPSNFGKLDRLRIGDPSLLQWEPMRRVDSVTNLTIDSCRCLPEEWLMQNCKHLKRLGVLDASDLEFLPSIMASLTSLEFLELKNAMLIQSLPELPSSLRVLQILGCHPVLKRHIPELHRIAHIPELRVEQELPSSYSWHSYQAFVPY